MENIASITTYILNFSICLLLAFHFKNKLTSNKISKKKAKWSYIVSVLVVSFVISGFVLEALINIYESYGFTQEFGHMGEFFSFVINIALDVAMLPIGLMIINWEPIKW